MLHRTKYLTRCHPQEKSSGSQDKALEPLSSRLHIRTATRPPPTVGSTQCSTPERTPPTTTPSHGSPAPARPRGARGRASLGRRRGLGPAVRGGAARGPQSTTGSCRPGGTQRKGDPSWDGTSPFGTGKSCPWLRNTLRQWARRRRRRTTTTSTRKSMK